MSCGFSILDEASLTILDEVSLTILDEASLTILVCLYTHNGQKSHQHSKCENT